MYLRHSTENTLQRTTTQRYWEILKSTCKYFFSRTLMKNWLYRIELPSSERVLYVNPLENRGRILCMTGGVTQQRLNRFWNIAVLEFKPSMVVDVGVNYGEFLFSVTYPKKCKLYGIEANQNLKKYIERSKKLHPNRKQMKMIYAMASNEERQQQPFYVNKYWSGLSSVDPSKRKKIKYYEQHEINCVTLDSLLQSQPLEKEKLLFKIDVEGHEDKVLQGMIQAIDRFSQMLGVIEFDSKYLIQAQSDVDAYLKFLQDRFQIYIYVKDQEVVHFQHVTLAKLQKLFRKKNIHTDFIVTTPNVKLPDTNMNILELD